MASNRKPKKKTAFLFPTSYVVAGLVALAVFFTIYLGHRISLLDGRLFSVGLLALFAGVLVESFRITADWKKVPLIFLGSYLVSLTAFIPGRGERVYDFEQHLVLWPFYFLFFFLSFLAIENKEKVTAKLTEGITLLLSVSFVYWLVDRGAFDFSNWFETTIVIISLAFVSFSVIHALTNIRLTRANRLWLSIWSTIVVFAISVDNVIDIFRHGDAAAAEYFWDKVEVGLQYFFLGLSAVYVVQNLYLLSRFIPNRNGNYRTELKENIADHINRYDEQQVKGVYSLLCIVYALTAFCLNNHYLGLPCNTMIWVVIFTFPVLLRLLALKH